MKIIILGAGVDQVEIIKKSKELGYTVYVADKQENPIGKQYADFFLNIDPKDTKTLEAIITKEEINAICTMASNLIPRYVSILGERCNLRTISYGSSVIATDKEEFKERFKDKNIPIVNGGIARNIKQAISICEKLEFPIVFKPADGSGCRGINIVNNIKDIEIKFNNSISNSIVKSVVVEEFLDNQLVFGVESLINNGKTFIVAIADKIIIKEPAISTVGVTIPTILGKKDIGNIEKIVESIHKELDISMGASHIDFIFDNGIPRVIDIGPRLAGGPLIFELIQKTRNMDMIKFIIEQSLRDIPDPIIEDNNLSAVSLHFFSPTNGQLLDYHMPLIPSDMTISWRKNKGDFLKNYGSNIDRIGYLTCVGTNIKECKKKIINIIKNIAITLKNDNGIIETISPKIPNEFL